MSERKFIYKNDCLKTANRYKFYKYKFSYIRKLFDLEDLFVQVLNNLLIKPSAY